MSLLTVSKLTRHFGGLTAVKNLSLNSRQVDGCLVDIVTQP